MKTYHIKKDHEMIQVSHKDFMEHLNRKPKTVEHRQYEQDEKCQVKVVGFSQKVADFYNPKPLEKPVVIGFSYQVAKTCKSIKVKKETNLDLLRSSFTYNPFKELFK